MLRNGTLSAPSWPSYQPDVRIRRDPTDRLRRDSRDDDGSDSCGRYDGLAQTSRLGRRRDNDCLHGGGDGSRRGRALPVHRDRRVVGEHDFDLRGFRKRRASRMRETRGDAEREREREEEGRKEKKRK